MLISISVVIHNYNEEHVNNLLRSYKKSCDFCSNKEIGVVFELYIVDNSERGYDFQNSISAKCLELGIKNQYIKTINKGYGHAHNIIINGVLSDYHIVCNPDIVFYDNTLYKAIFFMERNINVAHLIPDVYNMQGQREYLCKRNPTFKNQFLRRFAPDFLKNRMRKTMGNYVYLDKDYNKPIENVEYATGCFMFFRTKVLKKAKGFDERYFLYLEDADITREVLQISNNIYLPDFKVIHNWERASYKSKKMMMIAIISYFKYWLKWKVKGLRNHSL